MGMRVRADLGRCQGYANCVIAAPRIFSLGDAGLVEVIVDSPSDADRAAIDEAVRSCPVAALSLDD